MITMTKDYVTNHNKKNIQTDNKAGVVMIIRIIT